jgi:3-oxoacyl-[acyl-carrier-protein] synthase-3
METAKNHAEMVSFAAYLPEKTVETTSFAGTKDLPRSLDFVRLTGITSHHEVAKEQGSLELAVQAGKKAMARAGIDPSSLGLIINASVSKMNPNLDQHLSPSLATLVANELGAKNAQTFDVSNACAGMVTALMIAESRIKSGKIEYAMVISGEFITPIIDEAKRRNLYLTPRAIASLTVGDGSAAYILGRTKHEGRIKFSEPFTFAQYNRHCIGQASKRHRGPQMRTKARDLQNGVMTNIGIFLQRSLLHMDLKWNEIDHTYSHPTTPKAVKKGAKIASDLLGEINFLHNDSFDTANTASTTHGVLLEKSQKNGYLQSDETAIIISFGSGLAILAMHFNLPEGVKEWS